MHNEESAPVAGLRIIANTDPLHPTHNQKQALKAYTDLAIGNAAFPIGIAATSIHARTARDRISAANQQNIMKDEKQRQYVTTLKRLMTLEEARAKRER